MNRDEVRELLKDVQELLLPRQPVVEGYAFFDYYQPATQIRGEYYDYIRLADGRWVVVVASGLGFAIRLTKFMAKLPGEVRSCLASKSDPAEAVTRLNKRMCQFDLGQMATFVLVTLDPNTHEVTIVNAGQSPPVYRHLDGGLSRPGEDDTGIPIGVVKDFSYVATEVTLQPGESLTLFTDGLVYARNAAGELFTFNPLCEIVAATNGDPMEIGDSLLKQVRQHLGSHPQDDDMCLISFGRVPTARVPCTGT